MSNSSNVQYNVQHMLIFSLLVAFLWSIQPFVMQYYIHEKGIHMSVIILVVAIVSLICFTIYLSLNFKNIKNSLPKLRPSYIAIIGFTSVMTVFLANILYFLAIKTGPPYIISALTSTAPIFAVFIAYTCMKSQINTYSVLGVLLMVIAVILVCISEKYAQNKNTS